MRSESAMEHTVDELSMRREVVMASKSGCDARSCTANWGVVTYWLRRVKSWRRAEGE